MEQILRIAIAGQGRSGHDIHANVLRKDPRFKIVAAADALPERREQAAQEFGCPAFESYQEMLDKGPDFDIFVNATPSRFHVDAVMAAVKRAKLVVCEKPSAPTVEIFDNMVKAAKENDCILYPFQNARFAPYFRKMKEVIDSGVLGKIMYIRSNWSGFGRRWDWQTRQDQMAGNLFNTGPHPLDHAIVLFGDAYPQVSAVLDAYHWDFPGDADNLVLVRLTGDGPVIDLDISSMQAYKIGTMYNVCGTHGGLIVDGNTVKWKYFDPEKAPKHEFWQPWSRNREYCSEQLEWIEKEWTYENKDSNLNGFEQIVTALYSDVYEVFCNGKEPEVKLDQVRRQVYVLEEAHKQNPLPVKPLK